MHVQLPPASLAAASVEAQSYDETKGNTILLIFGATQAQLPPASVAAASVKAMLEELSYTLGCVLGVVPLGQA